ncbi:MAG TPA: sporulation transcription factor Spo0A [Symbiobacteriaceae bacterium]|nr:sporulation transcription factor Spo0A [Symbiobacteriaceae bacterium]
MLENRTTLVIADDNPTNRRALVDHFDSIPGFAVLGEAKNGVEAVELVQALRPHLLILDDVLPHLDGLGVLGRLDPHNKPRVLMLMSCASDSLVQLYSDAGATYCLLRPAMPELVAERAAFLMDRHIALTPDRSTYIPMRQIRTVSDLLRQTGVPAHLQGFRYLKAAVQYVLDNGGDLCAMTKELYPAVARMHGTVPARVERSIRHAIEVAWNRADLTELQRLFGSTINHSRGKPTNSEFVAMLADHLRNIAS